MCQCATDGILEAKARILLLTKYSEFTFMWFHFCTFNHDPIGRSTLVDMAAWIEAGLIDSGHKVTFSESHLEPNAINVFWECFRSGMGKQIRETGVKYGIIATEIPDGTSFNWRTELNWKNRFDAFFEVASGSSFIWTMVESTIPFYSSFCPTAFMELGFSERLIPPYINVKPEFDFSFFGLKTPYRIEAIERIRKYAKVEWPENFLSADQVGVLISKTRVGLNFKQSETWPVPSPTRLGRLMMAKRDIASEHVEVATRQGMIIGLAPQQQDFVDFALERLNSDWEKRAEKNFETYRDQMPMTSIMESVLDKTVAGLVITDKRKNAISIELPPVLIATQGDFNIVHYRDKYFGLLKRLGPIDLVNADIDSLPSVFVEVDRRTLEAKIASLEGEKPVEAIADQPIILEQYTGFNLFSFHSRYFAVRHCLGEVDLIKTIDALLQDIPLGDFLISHSLDELKYDINTFSKSKKVRQKNVSEQYNLEELLNELKAQLRLFRSEIEQARNLAKQQDARIAQLEAELAERHTRQHLIILHPVKN